MKKIIALRIIAIMSLVGMLFSGWLSYGEVIMKVCPVGGCSSIFGVSVCLYGFVMFAIIFVIGLIALCSKK